MTLPGAGLNVAICGAGMISALHRRGALLAGATVRGVLASSPARSAEVAADWGVTGYPGLAAVLADDTVDVVHIATPNATHHRFALDALAAGKHVVCEKPLGLDLAQAKEMAAAAEASDRVATVPFVYRFHAIIRELRARVQAGEFGAWNLIHGSYLQDWMLSPEVATWRTDPAQGGASRAFGDIGSHWIDLVEWVAGVRFTELVAATSIAIPQRPSGSAAAFSGEGGGDLVDVTTEDSAILMLRDSNGLLANATISQLSAGRKNRLWFELDGAQKSAVFDQEQPEFAWLGGETGFDRLARDAGLGSEDVARLSKIPSGHAQGYADAFDAFVADTYAAARGEWREGLPTFADGLRTAAVTATVLESAAAGAWTTIPTFTAEEN
ncbi:Gfo/Idh/MocA family protein [Parenemella sanctibonifatiensis]|uniref:Gfo/Idh/MocA family protein n=1 Tax=Parenemella sanctibonifatiensis TaxID=2016505 RepID=UPI001E3FF84E|nr:Gfo/Idh/MocA family oxidoreductase [Parenemella sanctibonifatiensis]